MTELPGDVEALIARFRDRLPPAPQFLGWMYEFSGSGEPIPLLTWREGDQIILRPEPPPRIEPPHDPGGGELGGYEQGDDDGMEQRNNPI